MAGFGHRAATGVEIAMVAHPSVTLLVDLSDEGAFGCSAGARRASGSFVAGLIPGDLRVTGRGPGACLQIRLAPVAAAAVLGGGGGLSGAIVPLGDVWGPDAAQLEDRLRRTRSWDDRFAIATASIGARMRHRVDPEVAHAWHRTLATRGRARIDDLARETGWSRKRLWSRFRAQLGVPPKRAARLVRFDGAAHLLAAGHAPAAVATASGYADQSHLHHEIREFAGLTPAGVAAAPWLQIDDVAWPTCRRSVQLPGTVP